MKKAGMKDKSVDGKVKVGQMHSELFLKHLQGSSEQVCLALKCHHKSHNPIMFQHLINCDYCIPNICSIFSMYTTVVIW